MNSPFYKYGLFNSDIGLLFALIIGIAFGFFLERGGLGDARKLSSQFYFRDMTVFKMMFSAIITAMIGLFILHSINFINIGLIDHSVTYLVPQLIGGLIFGVGFVIGGYCPGTSCVALSSGRVDAVLLLLGMMTGIFVFGELFPLLKEFYYSSNLGVLTFPSLLNMPFGIVAVLFFIMALAGFYAAEKIEKKFS